MLRRGAVAALKTMAHNEEPNAIVTERVERRLAEECGKVRIEMVGEFGKLRTEMAQGFGELRSDMISRNGDLLKWLLVFFTMQTAALAALLNFLVK